MSKNFTAVHNGRNAARLLKQQGRLNDVYFQVHPGFYVKVSKSSACSMLKKLDYNNTQVEYSYTEEEKSTQFLSWVETRVYLRVVPQ